MAMVVQCPDDWVVVQHPVGMVAGLVEESGVIDWTQTYQPHMEQRSKLNSGRNSP